MAFKLTKQETERRDQLIADLGVMWTKVESAVDAYNEDVGEIKDLVENAVSEYNKVLEQAREFAGGIASRAEEEIDNKNESWQDSDRGQEASEWKTEWEDVSLEDLEAGFPDELEIEQPDHASDLGGLPIEAG
jgi:hypothetical protein